jgi:hypothetical protein
VKARAATAACALLLLTGCSGPGSDEGAPSGNATAAGSKSAAAQASGSPQATPAERRERRMRAVVRSWSSRLNAGDNTGVARLFAVPAVMVQAPYVYRLRTRAQVAGWHAGLPCSGRILSISIEGRYATAVFELGHRGSRRCNTPGTIVAARFEIVNGKIVSWEQVPPPEPGAAGEPAA